MATLSITDAWTESAAFIRREAALLVPVSLAFVGLPLAIAQLVVPPMVISTDPAAPPVFSAWMLLAIPVVLLSLTANLSIMTMALTPGISVAEAIRNGTRRLPIAVGAALLLGILGTALLIPISLFSVVLGAAGGGMAVAKPLAIGLSAGLFLFIGVRLLPLYPLIAMGSGGSVDAIKRGWTLSAGHFGKLIGLMMMGLLAMILVGAAVQTAGGAMALLIARLFDAPLVGAVLTGLIDGLFNAAATIVIAVVSAAIYRQLAAPIRGT